jgi:hypothetical protein
VCVCDMGSCWTSVAWSLDAFNQQSADQCCSLACFDGLQLVCIISSFCRWTGVPVESAGLFIGNWPVSIISQPELFCWTSTLKLSFQL